MKMDMDQSMVTPETGKRLIIKINLGKTMIGLQRISLLMARQLADMPSQRLLMHSMFTATTKTAAKQFICVSEEVQEALQNRQPVVALESTILTHGLPADRALHFATTVEEAVRSNGAVPATIAVLDSHFRVGLTHSDFDRLVDAASCGNARKAAIRDLPFALTCPDRRVVFGTTVSATSFIAYLSGISVFATGGIGGVHRGAEVTMDISSDLLALASIPVAVVSAGVKSILDVPKTLEVLESMGVTIASVGTDKFPAFFTRDSGVDSPGRVDSPEEAARLFATSLAIRPSVGMLLAVPIPENMEAVGDAILKAVRVAHEEAEKANINGAAVTPFMLERVRQLTDDASLEANVHLVLNNAKFAAQTAVKLSALINTPRSTSSKKPQIIVIGGSNVDISVKLKKEELKTTKDIHPPASYEGTVEMVGGGGVGRNVAEAVGRLSSSHLFLTAISNDAEGQSLLNRYPFISWKTAPLADTLHQTAKYVGILNSTGELLFGIADMDIHKQITPAFIESVFQETALSQVKVICSDGNVDVDTLKKLINFAKSKKVPFWYEPTDLHKCIKIVDAIETGSPIDVISPNMGELKAIYQKTTGTEMQVDSTFHKSLVDCICKLRRNMRDVAKSWVVKMGKDGVLFVNECEAYHFTSPVLDQTSIASVSGAGDSSVGAMLYLRYIKRWPWRRVVLGGLRAAELSLACKNPVPESLKAKIFDNERELEDWALKIGVETFPSV